LLFFQILWHFCCFNLLLKAYWACFCENLLILGLFSRFATLLFYLIFLLIFRFVEFSCQRILGLFLVKLPIFGLFFKFTCFFLQNNLASLLQSGS